MGNNFEKISAKLEGNEQLALDSMLQGESVVETAHSLAVSVQEAQALRKAVYYAAEEFVEFGSNTKEKQQKLIDFCKQDETEYKPFCTIEEEKFKKIAEELEVAKSNLKPFEDDYFKGLTYETIAELAKKSNRLTEDCSKLEQYINKIAEMFGLDPIDAHPEELLQEIAALKTTEEPDFGNFLVFNPEKGSPNKVYKDINGAIANAKEVAKKEQDRIFVLRIASVITPHCSFDIQDVSKSGIPSKYMQKDEIPF